MNDLDLEILRDFRFHILFIVIINSTTNSS